jgi:hypothetical protein
MRWYWTAALVVLLLLPVAGAQELRVENLTVESGGVAEVPIVIEDASNIGSIDIVLWYDSQIFTLESVEKGKLTSRAMLRHAEKEPGVVKIGIVQAQGINGNGSVAVLRFDVKGEAGMTSLVDIVAEASDAKTVRPVALKTAGGTLTVVEKKSEQPKEEEAPKEEKRGICGPTLVSLLAAAAIVLRRSRAE